MTGQTARAVRDDPALREVVPRLLDEANSVAQSYIPDVRRLTRSGPAPDHKPSILQDYELGRAMEIDVLVKAPAAFARAAGLSTPMLDLMAALAVQKARDKGLYRVERRASLTSRSAKSLQTRHCETKRSNPFLRATESGLLRRFDSSQ